MYQEIEPEFRDERRILGSELKLIRCAMGLKQQEFLALLKERGNIEFSQAYWSKIESGHKRLPFVREFDIMECLNLTLAEVKQLRAIRRKFSPERFNN
ncbi:hypothetical protein [Cytobacillus firmus]|uniref:hypothetical protein n=1 Tax=Cytobacillus firmus TaxID=1399 RepID=UPI001CFEF24F|nr:hypothetical protein [Cytobacillus firmus]